MKLASFQIINCFGFQDSNEIDFHNTKDNLIYIIGRNSSGKSSLLNAINCFGIGKVPINTPRFKNFIDTGKQSKLIAKFLFDGKKLSFEKFNEDLESEFRNKNINDRAKNAVTEINELVKNSKLIYENLIDELNSQQEVEIHKLEDGTYHFIQEDFSKYKKRREEISNLISNATDHNGLFRVGGQKIRLEITPNTFEKVLFLQFPIIQIFDDSYSLNASLPNEIKHNWKDSSESFEKRFIEYLDSDKVDTILETNDPKKRREIEKFLNKKVKILTDRVNENQTSSDKQDLIEIDLGVSPGEGIQITVYTDGKPSFYSHLSENTKFLFAYHLYRITTEIKGTILLFDEPNNGFHPTAQKLLLRFLQQLGKEGNLVIVSTHSEYLIDINYLSSVRLMSVDNNDYISVKNHFYNQPNNTGDYLALQPIYDAIGFRYGNQLGIKKNVIITEGITDLLYLHAFNKILKIVDDINVAPARGDSTILSIIPFLISQGIDFKIVIDTGKVKDIIKSDYGVDDKFFYEIPIPKAFPKMKGSGIEDLFSETDFKTLLLSRNHKFEPQFSKISNSSYMGISTANKIEKRLIAQDLYQRADTLTEKDFETETIDNFRKVLEFCKNSDWFYI